MLPRPSAKQTISITAAVFALGIALLTSPSLFAKEHAKRGNPAALDRVAPVSNADPIPAVNPKDHSQDDHSQDTVNVTPASHRLYHPHRYPHAYSPRYYGYRANSRGFYPGYGRSYSFGYGYYPRYYGHYYRPWYQVPHVYYPRGYNSRSYYPGGYYPRFYAPRIAIYGLPNYWHGAYPGPGVFYGDPHAGCEIDGRPPQRRVYTECYYW